MCVIHQQYDKEGETLENYTKYRLKDEAELAALLEDKDNLFVIACNKCFKQFETTEEPDGDTFAALAAEKGKKVTGIAKVDFLCNKVQTEKKLREMIPEGTENVIVVSCGLGVQTVADLKPGNVFAACNSIPYRGQHGMALSKKACDACAQCYLNVTGGICPVVDCSKSLLNGQCGGAKNGKCELDPEKDCAWEKIYRRLEAQGRLQEFLDQPVQTRDYSKVNFKTINEFVKSIRDERFAGYYGGVHPLERKELSNRIALQRFPQPDVVVIPLSMHFGAPATPVVAAGDTVKMGQLIGQASAFISSNIHSSVSGKVLAVEPRVHPIFGPGTLSVVIENDKQDTLDESVVPNKDISELTPEEIIAIIKDKGITGMGGAGFPAYVKLMPKTPVDSVLINACECEPLLTADHRVLLEFGDRVLYGLRAMVKAVGAEKGYIVIEDNKPDAIAHMKELAAPYENIEIVEARTKYPQGAEKMLIKRVLGRQVPSGGLPADAGAVVSNASTSKAIADAIQLGQPLFERVTSVTGERMAHPGNYIVKVGTPVQEIIDYCGGITGGKEYTVKMGGVMMGTPLSDLEVPIIKSSNGIIAVDTEYSTPVDCIKCGRCADVCPMELNPLYFAKYADEGNVPALKQYKIMDCMECRCCEYICSSRIPLVTKIKAGKKAVKEAK